MESIKITTLQELFSNKHKYKVSEEKGHWGVPDNSWNGVYKEYNKRFVYYKHPEFPQGFFMREIYRTDSYDDNKSLENIEFVQGKEKTITVFEPI